MEQQPIRFDDGPLERLMGAGILTRGMVFLDWLLPAAGQRWIDVGCGNGAFTELADAARYEVQGIDHPRASSLSAAPGRG